MGIGRKEKILPEIFELDVGKIFMMKAGVNKYPIPNLGRRCSSPHLPLKLVDLFSTSYLYPIGSKFLKWLEEG